MDHLASPPAAAMDARQRRPPSPTIADSAERTLMTGLMISLLLLAATTQVPALQSGPALLAKTIAYHDPDGSWMEQRVEFSIETGYADGRTLVRLATVDYASAAYRDRVEEGGRVLEQEVRGDSCRLSVDGSEEADAALLDELGLSCESARRRRDYVSYLWGLPMKLKDPGAHVADEVHHARFQDRDVLDLTVDYDPEVGTDVWHMYIDPATARLVGYAFYKTPAEENGEYIVLEEERAVGTARIPAKRHWYEIPGGAFLGTDTLLEGRVLGAGAR
jgi:hypothetical protein